MSAFRPHERRAPDEIREQLARQLQVDEAHLAAIPSAGLYRLREQLTVDDLTGVLARRAGLTSLVQLLEMVRQSARPELALVFVDVDGLKRINDTEGHAAGDLVLRAVADVLQDHLRTNDIVFRYGGDEFVCAMPFTSLDVAGARLMAAWRALHEANRTSFSAGFAELWPHDDADALIERADACLYAGRRRSQRREWRVAR